METRKIAAVIILTCLIVGVVFVFYVNRPKSESERLKEATDELRDLMEEYNRRLQEIEDEKAVALKEFDDNLAEQLQK